MEEATTSRAGTSGQTAGTMRPGGRGAAGSQGKEVALRTAPTEAETSRSSQTWGQAVPLELRRLQTRGQGPASRSPECGVSGRRPRGGPQLSHRVLPTAGPTSGGAGAAPTTWREGRGGARSPGEAGRSLQGGKQKPSEEGEPGDLGELLAYGVTAFYMVLFVNLINRHLRSF